MSQESAESVLVYADYVCPFCYLGYESLDQYRDGRDDPLGLEWHPFDLRSGKRQADGRIDHTVDTGKDDAYFEQVRENVEQLARRYGVRPTFAESESHERESDSKAYERGSGGSEMVQPFARAVDSFDAQRVALRVSEEHPDWFDSFHRGTFDALWERGRDIGHRGVLEDVAAESGLPEGFVAETLSNPVSADRLDEAFEAAQRRGVTGVPTFVYGEYSARGAVPPEQLQRLVERIR